MAGKEIQVHTSATAHVGNQHTARSEDTLEHLGPDFPQNGLSIKKYWLKVNISSDT
jgi:hypothetical protein